MIDTFETLTGEARMAPKIERSEFIGVAFPVTADDAFFPILTQLQKEFFDATHHCWGFRLRGELEHRSRSSDAGEPSGTAGKPIANAIEAAGLVDSGVVVIRYYGGVKLGTGGLARAYRDAAREVLAVAPRTVRHVCRRIDVTVPHPALSQAYRLISPPAIVLAGEEFGETNLFSFDVKLSSVDAFAAGLTEKRFEFAITPLTIVR